MAVGLSFTRTLWHRLGLGTPSPCTGLVDSTEGTTVHCPLEPGVWVQQVHSKQYLNYKMERGGSPQGH